MTSAAALAAAVRRGVGVFPELPRGLIEVAGGDRVRWLNGMISADVAELASAGPRRAAYALLLSPKGRILADLHVIAREDRLWLETDADQVEGLLARLERYVIADDVELCDESGGHTFLGLEGPSAVGLVTDLVGSLPTLRPDDCVEASVAGSPLTVCAWGYHGAPPFRLIAPAAARPALLDEILAHAGAGLVQGDADCLEVLRIEAGVPRFGAELDEDVFPAEAGLVDRAVSFTKGCFTGQEIVARLESRGQVNHRLVGLRFERSGSAPAALPGLSELPEDLPDLPEVGTSLTLEAGGKVLGEVTSVAVSESAGAIGLGFVRLPHDAPDTCLLAGERLARVAPLPLVGDLPAS